MSLSSTKMTFKDLSMSGFATGFGASSGIFNAGGRVVFLLIISHSLLSVPPVLGGFFVVYLAVKQYLLDTGGDQ